jgi:hypothetical protein
MNKFDVGSVIAGILILAGAGCAGYAWYLDYYIKFDEKNGCKTYSVDSKNNKVETPIDGCPEILEARKDELPKFITSAAVVGGVGLILGGLVLYYRPEVIEKPVTEGK